MPNDPEPAPQDREASLPFSPLADIERMPEGERWLVEGLLSRSGIAVLASTPKTGKTWVALALAVGVASGSPVLGQFHVPNPGRVVLFPAEDDARAIRERVESLCLAADLELEELPFDIITADQVRLDEAADRARLERLLSVRRPSLLVLDPLVRLHSGAESYSGHVAELFGYLRALQRRFELAVVVTHHLAKNRRRGGSPGEAMRGSGDIHASYDTGLLLERERDGRIVLTLEHRSAVSPEPFAFRLVSHEGGGTFFEREELDDSEDDFQQPRRASPTRAASRRRVASGGEEVPLAERVLKVLRRDGRAVSQVAVRRELQVRNQALTEALRTLEARGLVEHLGRMKGWRTTAGENGAEAE